MSNRLFRILQGDLSTACFIERENIYNFQHSLHTQQELGYS
jgi:hypothetical protein